VAEQLVGAVDEVDDHGVAARHDRESPAGLSIAAPAIDTGAGSEEEIGMARYVDGFVVPVPKGKLAAYRRLAQLAGKVWRDHGALEYVEAVADDVKPGKVTSFPQAVKLKRGEVVVFSWITYRSRRQRDQVNAKVMADPRLAKMMDPEKMPFDAQRMFWGGFKTLVER
jgi:uncharacterized protein YbaA (DUF1428 family)